MHVQAITQSKEEMPRVDKAKDFAHYMRTSLSVCLVHFGCNKFQGIEKQALLIAHVPPAGCTGDGFFDL